MKLPSPRASLAGRAAFAALAAVLLAGCGEIKNTINPAPYTADQITVVLAGQPNAYYAGIYEAQALGLFKQSDLSVHIVTPQADQDPLTMVHDKQALAAISSEPSVLLHRNEDQPLVSVGAIVHVPLETITITSPPSSQSGGAGIGTSTTTTTTATSTKTRQPKTTTQTLTMSSSTSTTPTTTTISDPGAPLWPPKLTQLLSTPGYPTYDGLVIAVRKDSIVNHAGLVRRFVQAVARGYRAARANPAQAIINLITEVPSLAPQQALESAMLQAALPYIFPAGQKFWGEQQQVAWNQFGSWLHSHQLLSNPDAIPDAVTSELLPGQGV